MFKRSRNIVSLTCLIISSGYVMSLQGYSNPSNGTNYNSNGVTPSSSYDNSNGPSYNNTNMNNNYNNQSPTNPNNNYNSQNPFNSNNNYNQGQGNYQNGGRVADNSDMNKNSNYNYDDKSNDSNYNRSNNNSSNRYMNDSDGYSNDRYSNDRRGYNRSDDRYYRDGSRSDGSYYNGGRYNNDGRSYNDGRRWEGRDCDGGSSNYCGDDNYNQRSSRRDDYYRDRQVSDNSDNYPSNNSTSRVSDQDLSKEINKKLAPGWFSNDYSQVNAQVNDGVVKLTGSVKTWSDKEKLDKEIRNMSGVRELNSQIIVQEPESKRPGRDFPQDSAGSATDKQLNKKIRDSVSLGWFWNSYKTVTLNTTNGVVTLEGTLDDQKDEQKLMRDIQKIDGVKQVNSNIRIKNPE